MTYTTKYDIGDELFAIQDDRVRKFTVGRIDVRDIDGRITITYSPVSVAAGVFNEDSCARSKEELINTLPYDED